MIIDFKTHETIEVEIHPVKPMEVLGSDTPACYHWGVIVDKIKRECTCKQCGKIIDPFEYIFVLYRHFETRIDQRLEQIKAFDERERIKRERRKQRGPEATERLRKRRAESLERAAYNEYQAKLLTIRATKQRVTASRIEETLKDASGS